jgi:hypothetical protein
MLDKGMGGIVYGVSATATGSFVKEECGSTGALIGATALSTSRRRLAAFSSLDTCANSSSSLGIEGMGSSTSVPCPNTIDVAREEAVGGFKFKKVALVDVAVVVVVVVLVEVVEVVEEEDDDDEEEDEEEADEEEEEEETFFVSIPLTSFDVAEGIALRDTAETTAVPGVAWLAVAFAAAEEALTQELAAAGLK